MSYIPTLQTNGRGKVYDNLSQTVGDTPLVRVSRYSQLHNLVGDVLVKLEFFNPLSSVKDRLAYALVEYAEQQGLIKPDSVLVETTSGNTGIGLAFICAVKGYKLVLFMPETMSEERKKMLNILGAELHLTPGEKGMKGAMAESEEFVKNNPNSVPMEQFKCVANPIIHSSTTGPEIWADTQGKVDVLVVGVGTGGTITGTSNFLKSKNPSLKVVAVEPSNSPVLSGGSPGPHKIQGIGAGFIPEVLDKSLIDEIVTIKDEDAFSTSRELASLEGIPIGISSGAVLKAAEIVATRPESKGKTIVAILASGAERYTSTSLFSN